MSPKSVLLPTPLPANRPIRWPRPMVNNAFTALMPASNVCSMGLRSNGFIGSPSSDRLASVTIGPLLSRGAPAPSITRPKSAGPTPTRSVSGSGITRALGVKPRLSPMGIKYNLASENPTTSASTLLPESDTIRQRLPIAAWQPTASNVSPTIRTRRPSKTGAVGVSWRPKLVILAARSVDRSCRAVGLVTLTRPCLLRLFEQCL